MFGISAALAGAGCRTDHADDSVVRASLLDAAARGSTSSRIGISKASPTSDPNDARTVVFMTASAGRVPSIVREASGAAAAERRTLVVYVGASWCEPCQRFHHAAEAGALDGRLPRLALLEFDADRDLDRLAAAGYASSYIPLFALASADGTASSHRVEGGIKGEGAVEFILPRLRELLARWSLGPGG